MNLETIIYHRDGPIARVTLNRPDKLNAIDDAMLRDLTAAFAEAQQDPEVRILILKGAGRCFSAGQELSGAGASEVMPPNPRSRPYLSDLYQQAMSNCLRGMAFFDFPKWSIAQVHGYCLGAACDLAMSCKVLIASEDAVFGDPSIRMGLAPSTPLWVWRVGLKRAKELLFTGKYINGREAARIGLAVKVVPAENLEEEVAIDADTLVNLGTLGGFDEQASWWAFDRTTYDLAGLSAAWRFCSNLRTLSAIQRPGRSIVDRGGFNFYDARDQKGLKAAIEERDAPFREYFPIPVPHEQ